ncbi:MAG: hypothetical protein ACLFTR_02800 [Candidatus Woesearchaeota archaeon]
MFEDFVWFGTDIKEKLDIARKLGFSRLNVVFEMRGIDAALKGLDDIKDNDIELQPFLSVNTKKDVQLAKRKKMGTIHVYDGARDPRDLITGIDPDIITNLEYQKRDFMHHRSSGLNQITAKLIAERGIILGFNIGFLTSTKYKGEVMGRMSQNLYLSRKYGITIKAFSLARAWNGMSSPKDIISLLNVMGADQKSAKKALNR